MESLNLENLEDILLNDTLFLLIHENYLERKSICALFTSYSKAHEYLIKKAFKNLTNLADRHKSKKHILNQLIDEIESYQIISTIFRSSEQKIYKIQPDGCFVYGKPSNYLTNDLEYWNKKIGNMYNDIDNKYLNECTVEIDPVV